MNEFTELKDFTIEDFTIEDFNKESEEWTEMIFKQYNYLTVELVDNLVKTNQVEDINGNII